MKQKRNSSGLERRLQDLAGVGRATLEDLDALGVSTVEQLAAESPENLYNRLCIFKGMRVDICCLDVFTCVVAQAKDRDLPADRRNWWFWSRVRKGQIHTD